MCGIVGVYSPKSDAQIKALEGVTSLQHRGQESAGLAFVDGNRVLNHKGEGYISTIFTQDVLTTLPSSKIAIAHTRYSTAGSMEAMQPFIYDNLALIHNGNLTNAINLAKEHNLQEPIVSDSWVAIHHILKQPFDNIEEKLRAGLPKIRGAFCFMAMTPSALYLVRDPWGFRPLVLGQTDDGGWVAASETCALDLMEAKFARELLPGEGIVINEQGVSTFYFDSRGPLSRCVFEYIYIARPDSKIYGQEVHTVRKRFGQVLAKEAPVDADVVLSIPHSGDSAARGYSEESGLPLVEGVFANRYVGRAFIEPLKRRKRTTRLKYGVIDSDIQGKRVCAVDDSMVRGDASSNFVQMLYEHGAKEVHLRIAAPPLKFPCYFGVDFATKSELIANRHTSIKGIQHEVGVKSLSYLSMEGLVQAITGVRIKSSRSIESLFSSSGLCGACFTGTYAVKPEEIVRKEDRQFIEENYIPTAITV